MTTTPDASSVQHWTYQVDSPLRAPQEIRELGQGRPLVGAATAGPAEVAFGEDLAATDEEWEEPGEDEVGEADERGAAESDLLEEATAGEHPLASVFRLPRMAFDAMARGGWGTALAVAVGSGLRDVNQLTNMVFWFRHPQLIGQKLRPDQSDLVREWLQIRDTIVKPALAGGATSPPVPLADRAPTGDSRRSLPASGLRWYGPPGEETPELMEFMRTVYERHVQRSRGDFVDTLPASAIEEVESGQYARKDAAASARAMLAAARAAMAAAGLAGSVRIGVLSGYRSADRQFDIWQGKTTKGKGGFPYYYAQTRATRRMPKYGGEHSDQAADYLAQYMGNYVAAPGYSNHQDGLALDLGTGRVGGSLGRLRTGAWFHTWLTENAARRFHFQPLASEAWHWTYRPPAGGSASEVTEEEVSPTSVPAGRMEVPSIPLLAQHRGTAPDLVLRWNAMPTVPREVDVVVHFHGYSWARMTLPQHMEVWAGLDLTPVDGATGTGRSRPTLTVLPRGHFTGVKVGRIYRYTFPALTTRNGLDELIRVALEQFSSRVGGTTPTMARLILTAHSGGGAPLMRVLGTHDPHEVYVFDGLYQDATPLAEWARRHIAADRAGGSGAQLGAMRVFAGPSTKVYSLRLARSLASSLRDAPMEIQNRYRVESSRLGHWQIARQYGWRMLADPSADVPDATRIEGAPAVRRELAMQDTEVPFLPEAPFLTGEDEDRADEADEWEADEGESDEWGTGEVDTEGVPESENYDELDELDKLGSAADLEALAADLADPESYDESSTADTEDLAPTADPLTEDLEPNELVGDPLAIDPESTGSGETTQPAYLDEEPTSEQWVLPRLPPAPPPAPPPTVGFEFDIHYGIIPAVVTAAGLSVPSDGDVITKHAAATDGFKVKLDGPRLEVATKPFTVDTAGFGDLEKAIPRITAFADELSAGHRGAKDSTITIPGVSGHPRPFTLANTVVPGLPIARLWVRGAFNPKLDSVWASPQATVTVRLERVAALVDAIQKSEKLKKPGVALSGPSGRAGVRSEALYRARESVERLRRRMLAARPQLKLADGTVVDAKVFTPALAGFLILLAEYLWTSRVSYRFEDTAPPGLRDYEPFAKAYLPINVKAPFSEVFRTLLTDGERRAFRELFADGAARTRFFGLALPSGATAADGDRKLFPPGPKELGLDSVHERQRAEFGTVPTWNDLVEHTLDKTHKGWGDRLLVPISRPIPVSVTSPRVALELRRIGFASVYARQWPGLMCSVFRLVQRLDR